MKLIKSYSPATNQIGNQIDNAALSILKQLFDYDREIPSSMIKLQILADLEKGWLSVISSMINVIPLQESLGPSIILLLSEGLSLPTKESILKLPDILANIEQVSLRTQCVLKTHCFWL